jgi:low affinity Fe/Cu permease
MTKTFSRFAALISRITGKPTTFALCVLIILLWAVAGPVFHYSDTWQLVINTGTTIITFLQVVLIQNTQNRDGAAIQAKLDELIRASAARNRFIGIEELTEEELTELRYRAGTRRRVEIMDKAMDAAEKAEVEANDKAEEAARARGSEF